MKFPKCPECGAEMVLDLFEYNKNGSGQRYWTCVNSSWLSSDGCTGRIDIDPKKEIPWTVIAKMEARKDFFGSDRKRKEQTGLKRTITGIQTCKNNNAQYLSEKELKTLDAAMHVIDKYLTVSKKTKVELIKIEKQARKEEEARIAQEQFKTGEKFVEGMDHEKLLEKCEILNLYEHRRKDQWLDHTELMELIKKHRDNPKNKTIYRHLMLKVGHIIKSELFDQEEWDRLAKVEKEFLSEKEVQMRRNNLKVVE